MIAASCAVATVPAPMDFAAADGPVVRKALALSAAQTAVDVNEAKNNEHGSSIHRDGPCGAGV